ncbi:ankyrin repeat domain-containing protein [Pantoea ananatis]|uniref:ankyrin repeat domain-containing protein n=1 Tax=Pantoea ananas TaxID=553 RepID=UPI000E26FEEE|nr:ankyrin repeat domain-containing protein [Pantoea ananatis]REF11080.1 hypothetical protein C7428_0249 [Pantoea ananatis]
MIGFRRWGGIQKETEYLDVMSFFDINKEDSAGRNGLFYSNAFKTRWLIKHGINYKKIDNYNQTPFLMRFLSKEKINMLVKSGVNINHIDNSGDNTIF